MSVDKVKKSRRLGKQSVFSLMVWQWLFRYIPVFLTINWIYIKNLTRKV